MKRAESRATLRIWADSIRRGQDCTLDYIELATDAALDARSHGLAACNAMTQDNYVMLCGGELAPEGLAAREARLAVRAALNAVGLKTL